MSWAVLVSVFEMDLPPNEKLVLLAMARYADNLGESVFPSVALVARQTSYSPRQVQRIIGRLLERGDLEATTARAGGWRRTTHYRIRLLSCERPADPEADAAYPPRRRAKTSARRRPERATPVTAEGVTSEPEGVTSRAIGVTSEQEGVTSEAESHDTAMSPEYDIEETRTEKGKTFRELVGVVVSQLIYDDHVTWRMDDGCLVLEVSTPGAYLAAERSMVLRNRVARLALKHFGHPVRVVVALRGRRGQKPG